MAQMSFHVLIVEEQHKPLVLMQLVLNLISPSLMRKTIQGRVLMSKECLAVHVLMFCCLLGL